MLEKIRLSDLTRVKGLRMYPKGFSGRGQIYMYFDGGAHNRKIYELIGDVLVPLFSFHEIGFGADRMVEYFDINGQPLLNSGKPFENLPDAIKEITAPDPEGLPFMGITKNGVICYFSSSTRPLQPVAAVLSTLGLKSAFLTPSKLALSDELFLIFGTIKPIHTTYVLLSPSFGYFLQKKFALKKTFPIISRVSLFFNTNKTYEKTRFNQGSSYKSFN